MASWPHGQGFQEAEVAEGSVRSYHVTATAWLTGLSQSALGLVTCSQMFPLGKGAVPVVTEEELRESLVLTSLLLVRSDTQAC